MAAGLLGTLAASCIGNDTSDEGSKLLLYPTDKIVMFGDSITSPVWKYWAYLETSVNLYYTRAGLANPTYVNAGVAGDDTAAALARVEDDVVAEDPDVVFIFFGINDVSGAVAPATAAGNMEDIIDAIRAGNASVRIIGIGPWINGDGRPNGFNLADANINAMNTALRNVFISTYGYPWADIRGRFFAEPQSSVVTDLSTDGVHPTEKGKAWLSHQVLTMINLRDQ